MNPKLMYKALRTATTFGLNLNETIMFFNNAYVDYLKSVKPENPSNTPVLVSAITNDNLIVIPGEMDDEGKFKAHEGDTLNVTALIAQTDAKKALKIMEDNCEKEEKPNFFEVLQMAKKD